MSTPVINFTFHGLGDPPPQIDAAERDVWLSEADFLAALDAIRGLSAATISFDDGNASDLEIALPALRDRDLDATFFVLAGRLGEPGYLDADGLRTLRGAGMRIGLHGMRHRPWRGLGDRELEEEIAEARRLLEDEIGTRLDRAACPFGSYDRRVLGRLRGAGFGAVFTSDGGWADGGTWLQARNTLRAGDGAPAVAAIVAPERGVGRAARAAKGLVKRWR